MGEEWQAPGSQASKPIDPLVDEATLQRGLDLSRKVGVALLLCGLMHGASLAQILLYAYRQSVPIVLGELGSVLFAAVFIGVGSRIYEGSHGATWLGVAAAFAGTLFAAGWFVFLMFFAGTLSLLALLVIGASLLCGMLCLVLLPTTHAMAAARRRLFE